MSSTTEVAHRIYDLEAAEHRLVLVIGAARNNGVTWKAIANQFGHGDPAAAARWYRRRVHT